MKPREKTSESSSHPGFPIRLRKTHIAVLEGLAASGHNVTVNRYTAESVVTVLNICESWSVSPDLQKKQIPQLNRLLWRQLAHEDVRKSVPSTLSKPIKLTLPHAERQRIENISRLLRWSTGQVIVEAIQAYAQLAAGEEIIYDLPDIIRLYFGNRIFLAESEPVTVEVVRGRLNLALGRITRPSMDSAPTQPEPMTTDIDIELI
jgi:hypothetical protein